MAVRSVRLTAVAVAPDTGGMKTLLRRARKSAPLLVVTLYARAGCHLCDDARKPLARAIAATPGAVLRTVDIAGDAALEVAYGVRIPVVTATAGDVEHVIAEGKISDLRVRRALAALTAGG